MSLPRAATPQPLKPLKREVRERHYNKPFVPNPWTKEDDVAADFILSRDYDPFKYAKPIHTDECASRKPEPATDYTWRGVAGGGK